MEWLAILLLLLFSPEPLHSQENTPPPSSTPIPTLSTGLRPKIVEIFPNPEDSSEWIELYNPHPSSIDLDQYIIRDSTATNKIIISKINIEPYQYVQIDFATKEILNNASSDMVRLLSPQEELIDQVSYQSTLKGLSISLTNSSWCFTQPSPNCQNNSCYQAEAEPTSIPISNPTSTPSFSSSTPIPLPSSTSTPTPTVTPTPTNTPSITPTPTDDQNLTTITSSPDTQNNPDSADEGSILGVSQDSSDTSPNNPETKSFTHYLPLLLIISGSLLLLIPVLISKLKHVSST